MNEEPVEILVQMAERGEIDPWNIDIVEVTDRFLDELEKRKELDLRVSGRTLFYAATLLRLKSEQLQQMDEAEDEVGFDEAGGEFDLDAEIDLEGSTLGPIERLEREIKRRLERKDLRRRPFTLFELITILRDAEKEERRRRRLSTQEDDFLVDADDVVAIAHEESYQEAACTLLETCAFDTFPNRMITLQALADDLEWEL
ncbi:MAG: segregation/condensation protein A, partial [Methanoregulaceae archaeon]